MLTRRLRQLFVAAPNRFFLRTFNSLPLRAVPVFLVAVCAGAATQAQSTPAPRGDNQVWTEVQVAVPINHQTDFVLLGVMRFGRNVSRPVNERIGAGISFKLGKYLTVFPFYLHVAAQPTSTSHSTEERITLEATAKFPLGSFTLSDRNRVEFHFHSPAPNFTQYRNRAQIEHPLKFHELHVFVADEVFYDSVAAAWIRNRFYLGTSKKVNKHFTLELYFVRQNDSHSHPGDLNAVGSSFKFHI
jgi:hypothetical protein